jgi:hypothetical protein
VLAVLQDLTAQRRALTALGVPDDRNDLTLRAYWQP